MIRYENYYRCAGGDGRADHAEETWSDESSSTNNDHCPKCNAEIEPYESDEVEAFDGADIVICIKGGVVDSVIAPAGLSVQSRDYDIDNAQGDDLWRDEVGEECVPYWHVEPGAANADERPALKAIQPLPATDIAKRLMQTPGKPAPSVTPSSFRDVQRDALAVALIREALDYEDAVFDEVADFSAPDLLSWFSQWRERAKAVVG